MEHKDNPKISDIFIVGGGINGCGIARDAAGRGYSVVLAEMDDLASATSSASTKLFHGGLRYLEYFEIRLVREALLEREALLRAMPHISWPMRFVLPYHKDMRFASDTPASRVLGRVFPWMKGRRPDWIIRLGLWIYDHLGGRKFLPATKTLSLAEGPEGAPLWDHFQKAYEYSDCWIEDSRLVILNARDAAARGAEILTRTEVIGATCKDGIWQIETRCRKTGKTSLHQARMLVNAAGPWVGDILQNRLRLNTTEGVRLVRGSHIVTPKLFDHDKCYFFQGEDGRIIFAIPYETDFTLIGTTDVDHPDPSQRPECSDVEKAYLIEFANQYFKKAIGLKDIVWTYSGVRPLYDDGALTASAATRDYTLKVDRSAGAPVLNIFGGKITTYRRLAETAMDKIQSQISGDGMSWTAGVALPGGNFPVDGVADLIDGLKTRYAFLTDKWARRLVRAYGTDAAEVLGYAKAVEDLGQDFGATLFEAEVLWLMQHEFAQTSEDVLWRRSKLGLRLNVQQAQNLETWMQNAQRDHSALRAFIKAS